MAEEAIGVVLIGASNHARVWCDAYRPLPNVHLVGVYDDDSAAAIQLQRSYPELTVFKSLGDVLANSEVWIAEINTPVLEAPDVAERCLEAGISVGLRGTTALDPTLCENLLAKREKKVAIRVFSHAHYYAPLGTARQALDDGDIGDVQTLRVRSVIGQPGRADDPVIAWPLSAAPFLSGPEFDALPMMTWLGDVKTVHAYHNDRVTLVRWRSGRGRGGERYGVYEAVRDTTAVVRGRLEPVDVSFEVAGTDGYIFGGGLLGMERERPAFALYRGDRLEVPISDLDDDPVSAYRHAAVDLVKAARYRAKATHADDDFRRIAALREAIRESIQTGQETIPAE